MLKELNLSTMPCTELKGVGPKTAECLARLGIASTQDLLFHLPLRYQDKTRVRNIVSLQPGESALIEGDVIAKETPKGGKTRLLLHLQDDKGFIHLRFFHVVLAQIKALNPGVKLRCFGEVRFGPKGFEMVHPEYRVIQPGEIVPIDVALTPVYPTTEGLYQNGLRRLTEQALSLMMREKQLNLLSSNLFSQAAFSDIKDALLYVHRPPVDADQYKLLEGKHPAQQRLAFEELLAHRLSLLQARQKQLQMLAPSFPLPALLQQQLLQNLPFQLTRAQQRVLQEIQQDLSHDRPMLRLIQGDVGCGKTVIAALAAMQAIEASYQVAVMVPTEILAEQHWRNFTNWLTPLGIKVAYLSSSLKTSEKNIALAMIANENKIIAIGTHALFQEHVIFLNLGLIIVDEQHRFGVEQRLKLKKKAIEQHPHQLIMTATPIPRTLAMTAYADLDHSIIDELPPGRQPVKTVVIGNNRRGEVAERAKQMCLNGHQCYWVCTLIEESEILQCQAAEEAFSQLQQDLPDLTIELIHGRIKIDEKERIMRAFKAGEINVLVATTVIEVGVDVPNANLMIIEDPERLGLSQLHQLRGRVGRGAAQSFCVLLYHSPLSKLAEERLKILRDCSDGFAVAEKDLELRGPGEMLGTKQSGLISFRMADIVRDRALLPKVQALAAQIMESQPALIEPLIQRWLGNKTVYRQV